MTGRQNVSHRGRRPIAAAVALALAAAFGPALGQGCPELKRTACVEDPFCDPLFEPVCLPGGPCFARYDGCVDHTFAPISADHSVFVLDPAVLDAPGYSYGALAAVLAGPTAAATLVEEHLVGFTEPVTIGQFVAPPQPEMGDLVDAWPRRADGGLDLLAAPFLPTAIAYRFDLADASAPTGARCGELRIAFAYQPDDIFGLFQHPFPGGKMTQIFEFGIPDDGAECRLWIGRFARLSEYELGLGRYRTALRELTEALFVADGLRQVRTNELVASRVPWELRQFRLDTIGGPRLTQVAVAQQVDFSLGSDPGLLGWVRGAELDILADAYTVPEEFLAASAPNSGFDRLELAPPWSGGPVEAMLNLNACSGCHQTETASPFTHVAERQGEGTEPAQLSLFLQDAIVERVEQLQAEVDAAQE